MEAAGSVRLAELVAAISLSSDLGLGQPMEHVLRACRIALRLADLLGLDESARSEVYWVTLLATVCSGESFELVQMFGDDVAFRAGIYHVGPSQLAMLAYVTGGAQSGRPAGERIRAVAEIARTGGKNVETMFLGHCALTTHMSRTFHLDPGVAAALSNTFARWDGKGVPRGVAERRSPCRSASCSSRTSPRFGIACTASRGRSSTLSGTPGGCSHLPW